MAWVRWSCADMVFGDLLETAMRLTVIEIIPSLKGFPGFTRPDELAGDWDTRQSV